MVVNFIQSTGPNDNNNNNNNNNNKLRGSWSRKLPFCLDLLVKLRVHNIFIDHLITPGGIAIRRDVCLFVHCLFISSSIQN